MTRTGKKATGARLDKLARGTKHGQRDVRSLARFAANARCRLATLGFAAQVDFDQLLGGTKYAVPYGQSPFAFRRGNLFEDLLRRDGHKPILELLGRALGYDVSRARVANLRAGVTGLDMAGRAERTAEQIGSIVARRRDAPNLLDGAVLAREVGGVKAHFEADAVAAHFDRPIHAGEVKSFPTVDGQAEPEKVGAAMAQAAIYILLLRELVDRLGGDPSLVSDEALLITPLNTGLQPTLTVKPLRREIDRADRILRTAPSAADLLEDLPPDLPSFGDVAGAAPESARLDALCAIAEEVGTTYQPSCLSACGLSRFCRERAHDAGDPARVGSTLTRLLPGVASIDRAGELVRGAAPEGGEQAAAAELTRAADFVRLLAPSALARTGKGARA